MLLQIIDHGVLDVIRRDLGIAIRIDRETCKAVDRQVSALGLIVAIGRPTQRKSQRFPWLAVRGRGGTRRRVAMQIADASLEILRQCMSQLDGMQPLGRGFGGFLLFVSLEADLQEGLLRLGSPVSFVFVLGILQQRLEVGRRGSFEPARQPLACTSSVPV